MRMEKIQLEILLEYKLLHLSLSGKMGQHDKEMEGQLSVATSQALPYR